MIMSGRILPEVPVFQPEILYDPRREVLCEHVGNRDQVAQHGPTLVPAQVQRQSQLVPVLLVKVGPSVPELPVHVVVIQRVRSVAFQPLHRLEPDHLRAHVGHPLHRRRYGDKLAHLQDANPVQRTGHIRSPPRPAARPIPARCTPYFPAPRRCARPGGAPLPEPPTANPTSGTALPGT